MKIAGFSLLLAGWIIVVSALVLLASPPARAVFVLAGVAVELLGLVFVFRFHLIVGEEGR
jgi:hypothetical protein